MPILGGGQEHRSVTVLAFRGQPLPRLPSLPLAGLGMMIVERRFVLFAVAHYSRIPYIHAVVTAPSAVERESSRWSTPPGRPGRTPVRWRPCGAARIPTPRIASTPSVATMPAVAFDRFYRYAELDGDPRGLRRANIPSLVSIESIGKSHEGRDIWVLTVTSAATGPAAEKPRVLGRRQHPRDRSRGLGGRISTSCTRWSRNTARIRTSRARSTPARSTSARASIRMAPNGRSPTSRSGCARARVPIRGTRTRSRG